MQPVLAEPLPSTVEIILCLCCMQQVRCNFKVAPNRNASLDLQVAVSAGSSFCWSLLVLVIVNRFIYSLLGLKGFY